VRPTYAIIISPTLVSVRFDIEELFFDMSRPGPFFPRKDDKRNEAGRLKLKRKMLKRKRKSIIYFYKISGIKNHQ